MKVRVDFTIDIPADRLEDLLEFTCADDLAGARSFLKLDAEEYLVGYLSDNGIEVAVTRIA